MGYGIVIQWSESVEVIEFGSKDLASIREVSSSKEYFHSDEVYEYVIEPEVQELSDGSLEVKIRYEHEKNPKYDFDDISWGESRIVLRPSEFTGEAEWYDDNDDSRNGKAEWKRLDSPLRSSVRRKITTTKLQRDQANFRKLLLGFDRGCVITGEKNSVVLEAAHIIPVSDSGTDIPSNGLILRCDLHKLFDSGAFAIGCDGKIKANINACGQKYFDLLEDKELPDKTLKRVKRALIEKQNS